MALHFKREGFYYGRLQRRMRWLRLSIVCGLLLLAAGAVALIIFLGHHGANSPPDTSARTTTISYQPFKTFKTPYFSFEADNNWRAVPAESTKNSFVYRAYKNNLVERDLTVYVNQLPPRLMLTYILPVQAMGKQLKAGDISQHCLSSLPANYLTRSRNPRLTTMGGVSFTCWADSTSVTIGTGAVGGSYQVRLPHGQTTAQYFLLYHDLSYISRPEIFQHIAQSFESL